MKLRTVSCGVAAALLLVASACPLPQPLAELDGSSVAPARIVAESARPAGTRVLVAKGCPGGTFKLTAGISSPGTTYPVEARWFIDYDATTNAGVYAVDEVTIAADGSGSTRYAYAPPSSTTSPLPAHVVEVVVSNGFLALGDPTASLPNRSARTGFEAQVYRWVFEYADTGGTCGDSAG